MAQLKALLIGASGMVGSRVLQNLLNDPSYISITILVRKSLEIKHPKLKERIVNFSNSLVLGQNIPSGDIVFCCVGTTQKKVSGDKSEYRKVDFDIPVNTAKLALENGFQKFYLVSSVGADHTSSNFYLKLKGETENAITSIPFKNIGILRPSILLGYRVEKRTGEHIMKKMIKAFSLFMIGSIRKYRAIEADDVALAMIHLGRADNTGIQYLEYNEIMNWAKG